tara:strand:- start:447 stop:842 length:396 start_codon:yes stop_codon:yes gene_type:complete
MILFVERYTDFMIDQNPNAKFVYFETEKGDVASDCILQLRNKQKGLPLRHRLNMSDKGKWKDEDYTSKYFMMCSDFSSIIEASKTCATVVYPMISFNIALSNLTEKYKKAFEKEYSKLIAHNSIKKDVLIQ